MLSTLPLYSNGISRNNQPGLDDSYNPILTAILEDVTTTSGTAVSEIIPPGSITDMDGAVSSMAVVEVDNSKGLWQYSLNDGSSWINFTNTLEQSVAFPEEALLLSGTLEGNLTNRIRFIPQPNYPNENSWGLNFNGESSFEYKAWDETQLSAGLTLDTTNPTNVSVSLNSDEATIQVTAVNDDPILLKDGNLIERSYIYPEVVIEGELYTFDNAGFTVDDFDLGNNQLIFNISTEHGIINFTDVDTTRFISGNNSNTVTIVSSVSFINNYLSNFTYQADQYFTGYDTLFVRLNDQGKTGIGGGEDILKSIGVLVGNQNYAPVLNTSISHRIRSIYEDDTDNPGTRVDYVVQDESITDFNDNTAAQGIAICAVDNRNGIWQYSLDNGFSFTNISDVQGSIVELETEALLLDGDLTGLESNLVRFIPNLNYTGWAEIDFRAWDKFEFEAGEIVDAGINGGNTSLSAERDEARIYINSLNDSPELFWENELVEEPLFFVTEITSPFSYSFTSEDGIYVADSDAGEDILLLTLSVNQGVLFFNNPSRFISDNGTGSVTIAGEIELLNNYLSDFRYMAESDASGLESLTVTLDDLRNRNLVTRTINFQLTNAAPVFQSASQTLVVEDSELNFLVETSDVEGNPVTITGETLPEWMTITDQYDGTALLSGTPLNEHVGTVSFTLRAADFYTSTTQTFQLTVENSNDSPYLIGEISDLSTTEDFITPFNINLANYFADVDAEDVLVYAVEYDETHLQAVLTGSILTINSVLNWFGTSDIIVLADDQISRDTVSDTFAIALSPVNDIPVYTSIPALIATEDLEYVYDINLTDVDNSALEITALLLPEWLSFEVTGDFTARISGTPLNENVGQNRVSLNAADGIDSHVMQDFVIEVTNTNDIPTLVSNIADQEVSEDFETTLEIDLNNHFEDEDADDVLQYSVDFEESNISCNIINSILTFNSVLNWNGTLNITVVASDGHIDAGRSSVSDQFQILVTPVNDAPEFTSNPILIVNEDSEYLYAVTSLDVDDNAVLNLTADIMPEWLELNITGNGLANLVGTPQNENVGMNPVKLVVSDAQGRAVSVQEFDLEVINTNDAPVLDLALEDYDLEEDFSDPIIIELQNHFSDEDNLDSLTFQVQNISAGVNAEILGSMLTITSVQNWNGVAELLISASDNLETVSDNMVINISTVNDAPFVYGAIADFSFAEDTVDSTITMMNVFRDVDLEYGDQLSYSGLGNENIEVAISTETGIVTLTPRANWFGVETLVFTATDQMGETAADTVEVTVLNINDAPESTLPDHFSFNEDETLEVDFASFLSDIDSEELNITAFGNFEIEINITDLEVEFVPAANWSGEESVVFTISDGDLEITNNIQLQVAAINDAPTVSESILDFSFEEDTVYNEIDLNNVFTDEDLAYGDLLDFSFTGNTKLNIIIEAGLVEITPATDWFGTETIEFVATDLEFENVTESVEITVTNVNDAPVIALPETLLIQEDETVNIDFAQYCSDIDSDNLNLTTGDAGMINLEINGLMVSITPQENWSGNEILTFFLNDEESRLDVQDEILITVSAVNDAPVVVQEIADFHMFEDEPDNRINLQNTFSDFDLDYGDELSFSYVGNTHLMLELEENGIVNLIPEPEWNGVETITFTATDTELESISEEVTITVTEVNDAPAFILPANFSFNEDESLTLDFNEFVSDVDSDNITLTATGMNNIQIEINELNVVLSAAENWSGSELITFTASDSDTRLFTYGTVEVILNAVNDVPIVSEPLINFSFEEDSVNSSIDLAVVFSDADLAYGDELTYSFTGNQNISVELNDAGLVSLTPAAEWSGIEIISFIAEDLAGEQVEDEVEITILNVNDSPEINLPDSLTFAEDETLNLDFSSYISDIDSENLSLGFAGNTEITAEITGNSVTLTATENWSGSETITFSVDDNDSRSITTDEVLVVVEPVNDIPFVVTPLVDFAIEEDSVDNSINLNDLFSDYDLAYGDELSYLAQASTNFTIEISDAGLVTLTPNAEWFGTEELTFTAEDLAGEEISDNVIVTVNNVDDAPEINLPDSITMEEDTPITNSFDSYIEDIDSDILYLSVTGNDNIQISIEDREVTMEPAENWSGTENVTFTVSDSLGRSVATDDMDIIVTPVNDNPVVALAIDEIVIAEDGSDNSIQLNALFSDPDLAYGDELAFSVIGLQFINVEIDTETGVVEITSLQNWNGSELVVLTAEDNEGESVSCEFDVIVIPVNDAPIVIQELEALTILEDETYTEINLSTVFSDPDFATGDTLSFSYNENENLTVEIEDGGVTITPILNWNGETMLEFVATDAEGLWIAEGLNITVEAVNDEPIVVNPLDDIVLSLDESIQIDLNDIFHDEENELTFEILEQSSQISVEFSNESILLIQPVLNNTGQFSVIVRAEDGVNGRASTDYTFFVNVDPIYNHPEAETVTSELDFGIVFVSQESDLQTLEILNMGHANLDVDMIDAPNGFMIRKGAEDEWDISIPAFTIVEGDSKVLEILFTPEVQMSFNSVLTISSNAVLNPELEIELRGETKNPTPNAFTPNGDGKNDNFTISLGENSSDAISLHIINLNGREIRKIKGIASNPISWDGKDSDGKRCKASPYLYYLKQNGSRVMRGKVYLVK